MNIYVNFWTDLCTYTRCKILIKIEKCLPYILLLLLHIEVKCANSAIYFYCLITYNYIYKV